jgi:hypothetical protein
MSFIVSSRVVDGHGQKEDISLQTVFFAIWQQIHAKEEIDKASFRPEKNTESQQACRWRAWTYADKGWSGPCSGISPLQISWEQQTSLAVVLNLYTIRSGRLAALCVNATSMHSGDIVRCLECSQQTLPILSQIIASKAALLPQESDCVSQFPGAKQQVHWTAANCVKLCNMTTYARIGNVMFQCYAVNSHADD